MPGVKIIESMNVNALEIVVENLRQAYRAKLGVKKKLTIDELNEVIISLAINSN